MTELDGRTSLRGWRLAALAAGLVLANAAPAPAATYNTGASAPTPTMLWAYAEGNPPAPAPACHGVALSIKVPTGSLELTDMAFEIAPIQPGKVWFRLFVFDEMFLEWDEVWSGCDDAIGCQPQRTTPGVQGWEVASIASTSYGPIAPMTGLTWGPSGTLPDGHYGVVFCSDSVAGYHAVAADPFPSGGDALLRASSSGGFLWARDDLHSVVPAPGPPLAPTVAFTREAVDFSILLTFAEDLDGDGYADDVDCDDDDPTLSPGAPEVCDGQDNDCDGTVDEGLDGDGDGVTPCGSDGIPGDGDDDCDDGDGANFPGNAEVCDG